MTAGPAEAGSGEVVAFVLAGGGSLGAVQVGMLEALTAAGVRPDLVVGTSVGAVNGAFVAGGTEPADMADLKRIWLGIGRGDVFPVRPVRGLSALLTRGDALFSPEPLRRLVTRHLRYRRLEDAAVPVALVAADLVSGREVVLRSDDAVDAVLASSAIPGIFPPVTLGDLKLVDGGFVNHTPISTAVELGATTVYVLPTGLPCALARRPRGTLGVALQAVTNLLSHRLAHDIGDYGGSAELRVVPPPCPLSVSAADFGHTADLIHRAAETTEAWLAADMPDGAEEVLRPHHVDDGSRASGTGRALA